MKKLPIIFLILALTINLFAADWVIHAHIGMNPGVAFTRVASSGTYIEVFQFMYGLDETWSYVWDGWNSVLIPDESSYSAFTNGSVLVVEESWQTSTIPYDPNYGSSSVAHWWIEGNPPDWIGFSQVSMEGAAIGEYWVDYGTDMQIRVTQGSAPPTEFGKWLGDGTVNPYYVEPLAATPGKSRGKKHRK